MKSTDRGRGIKDENTLGVAIAVPSRCQMPLETFGKPGLENLSKQLKKDKLDK
jgi:hypothetical protein